MVTSVKLSAAMEAQLAAEARARRVSKSRIIKEALEKHFRGNGKKRRRTFGEAAAHLIGVIDGPGDMTTNPKYMKGYGE